MKRSGELPRRTPLHAKAPWDRKPARPRAPRTAQRRTGPPADVVLAVRSRDDQRCVLAGVLGDEYVRPLSTQHRAPRGMGGSSASWINSPINLVTVCGDGTSGHHGWLESHRKAAYALGLLVSRGRDDAATEERLLGTPVMVRGEWKRPRADRWRIGLPPAGFRGRPFAKVLQGLLQ